jgi:hypothetical protein
MVERTYLTELSHVSGVFRAFHLHAARRHVCEGQFGVDATAFAALHARRAGDRGPRPVLECRRLAYWARTLSMIPKRLGPAGTVAYPWIGVRGKLRRGDDVELADLLTDPPGFFVAVLDIRSLDELTDEGCDVLRDLAQRFMRPPRRVLTVIRPIEGEVAQMIESSGLAADHRIDWSEGSLPGLP